MAVRGHATTGPTEAGPPKGYLSEEAKRRFTITAGVLGAVFFFGQFILPMAAMMVIMPVMMFGGDSPLFRSADVENAAYWNGRVWYVEKSEGPGPAAATRASLRSLVPGSEEEPGKAASIELERPWLFPGNDRLWLIASSAVGFFKDGEVTVLHPRETLGDISRPFLYGGSPAVIEERPGGQALRVLVDGEWEKRASFQLGKEKHGGALEYRLRVLGGPEGPHLFLRSGGTLYYRKGLPGAEEDRQAWEPVAQIGYRWTAVSLAGGPAVFRCRGEGFNEDLVGLRRTGRNWRPFYTHPVRIVMNFGICPLDEPDAFVLLTQGFPGQLKVVEVRSGKVASKVRHGGAFPFPAGFMYVMFLPYAGMLAMPLILAFVLSALMRKHRVSEHVAGTARAELAPIWRRALAQGVDAVFLGGPTAVGYLVMMSAFMDPEEMFSPAYIVTSLVLVLGGLVWALAGVFVLSGLEGRWGATPGKWLLGIRVLGTDLKPCGFGRALVRNLLKFVDGFFNFMVGILLVALSENWQRVGDMAARTVVVRTAKERRA